MSDFSSYTKSEKLPFCKYHFEAKLQGKLPCTCSSCEHWFACSKHLGFHARRMDYANTVINEYPDGTYEVLVHDKKYPVLREEINRPKDSVDRLRKFTVYKFGTTFAEQVLIPKKAKVTCTEFIECLSRSSKRASDNFYGYGLANDWEYFVTLTFSPEKVNRFDDNAVKHLYTSWLSEARRNNPDIKVLVVPERHENGAIHFHGFMSNCPNIVLTPAFYPNNYKIKDLRGTQIYTKAGDPVLNVKTWEYGHSTVAILPKDNNNAKVVNYCSKYMRKKRSIDDEDFFRLFSSSDFGYNKKRYFHTSNLEFKQKYNILLLDSVIPGYSDRVDYYQSIGFEVVKRSDGLTVLRGKIPRL